jgi:hypothetical protein
MKYAKNGNVPPPGSFNERTVPMRRLQEHGVNG